MRTGTAQVMAVSHRIMANLSSNPLLQTIIVSNSKRNVANLWQEALFAKSTLKTLTHMIIELFCRKLSRTWRKHSEGCKVHILPVQTCLKSAPSQRTVGYLHGCGPGQRSLEAKERQPAFQRLV